MTSSILPHQSVHPHKRGEHIRRASVDQCMPGSSPQAWGTRHPSDRRIRTIRFIPTSVGNTATTGDMPCLDMVHPHKRGEHLQDSSDVRYTGWFIPTSVGNTFGSDATVSADNGSSPQAWGTHASATASDAAARFIPTSVGNTACLPPRLHRMTVHPHKRGEHIGISDGDGV